MNGKEPGTRTKLLVAAADTVRADGIAALSARTIAARARVNQALIFYHFGTVDELVDAAGRHAADERVGFYREQFAAVTSLPALLRLGRELHERERTAGNVALMAQLMAGAQHNQTYAGTVRYALSRWTAEIEAVIARVLGGSPLAELADVPGLAGAVSASFVGLELYDGVDAAGASAALDALERLGMLVEVFDELGPVARKALRARLRRLRRAQ